MQRPFSDLKSVTTLPEVDFLTTIGTIWRAKWLVLAGMLTGAVLAIGYLLFLAVPMYPATAVVALEAREQRVISDIESVLSSGGANGAIIQTEIAVLKSRSLAEALVTRLDLVSDPEFNGRLQTPSAFSLSGLRRRLFPATPSEEAIRNTVIDKVLDAIVISNQHQSLVFSIRATTTSAQKSALIANTLADLYIDNQLQVKFDATRRASEFLSLRAAELQVSLEAMEVRRNAFLERDQLISPAALTAATGQLRDLRARISDAEIERDRLLEQASALAPLVNDPAAFVELAADPRLSQLLRQRGADSPLVQQAIEAFLARRTSDADRLQAQIDSLVISEAELDARVTQQSKDLIELQQVERELEATRLLYESFLSRLKETNVQQGLQVADSRLLSSAVPRGPSSPRSLRILALMMILGGIIASAAVLLREMRFSGFRTSDSLRDGTGLTVLGSVPLAPTKARKDTVRYVQDKPNSVVAEAIRNLRTSLLMVEGATEPQVILITSSVPGEGKTTLAMSLANNMKGLGKRVLLIEADIRRRTFSQYFDTTQTPSLLAVLESPDVLKNADLHIDALGIDVLVGDESELNAADIFAGDRFKTLLKSARNHYDYILIDSPPVLAVPDARVIRPLADACVYVVHWNRTTRTQVAQGLQMFTSVGQTITGLVLSKVNSKEMTRYGYGGEYGYDSYSSKYYNS